MKLKRILYMALCTALLVSLLALPAMYAAWFRVRKPEVGQGA